MFGLFPSRVLDALLRCACREGVVCCYSFVPIADWQSLQAEALDRKNDILEF